MGRHSTQLTHNSLLSTEQEQGAAPGQGEDHSRQSYGHSDQQVNSNRRSNNLPDQG